MCFVFVYNLNIKSICDKKYWNRVFREIYRGILIFSWKNFESFWCFQCCDWLNRRNTVFWFVDLFENHFCGYLSFEIIQIWSFSFFCVIYVFKIAQFSLQRTFTCYIFYFTWFHIQSVSLLVVFGAITWVSLLLIISHGVVDLRLMDFNTLWGSISFRGVAIEWAKSAIPIA